MHEVGKYLTYVAPFAYIMEEDGGLGTIDDTATIQAAYAEKVVPMMCITNFTAKDPGSRLARTILSSTEIQNKLLTNIVNTMKEKGIAV